jgi:hypothetical protein
MERGRSTLIRITGIFFRPPLAIARLGGADTPMDSYVWREDPTVHGAARNVIEPAVSFEVLPDGSLSPFVPSVIRFRDQGRLRPVAPFLELWARIEHGAQDAGSDAPAPGTEAEVPLTGALLTQVGAGLSDVVYGVRVANRKAARRTGDESNGFSAGVQVQGDDVTPRPLLASSPPRPGGAPLVLPEHPVPLGCFQVIRPVAGQVGPVDLDVLRVRFTPARGEGRCCVVAWWAGWGAAVLGSNSGGEFGEAVRDPVPRINVGAKFVVAAVEVLNEGVPCADHFRRAQPFETAHRP